MIEILILSIVQGLTEFIPVSSSSHLFILSKFTNFKEQSLSIDVSMHIGSFIAVIVYFHKDILNFVENKILFIKILISSIPVMVAGFFLVEMNLIQEIRNLKIIGWTTLIFGLLLFVSDRLNLEKNLSKDFNVKSAIIIGIFQMISLVPGVSRSGITITAARLLKFKRYDAGKISFLLSIPTLGAVSFFGIKNIVLSENSNFSFLNLICIVLSFIFSLITIRYFLKFLKSFSLNLFVIYRIILGLSLLTLAYL